MGPEEGEASKEDFLLFEECLGVMGVKGFDHDVPALFQVFGKQGENSFDQIEAVFLIEGLDASCAGCHVGEYGIEIHVPERFEMEKVHLH